MLAVAVFQTGAREQDVILAGARCHTGLDSISDWCQVAQSHSL